MGGGGGSGVGGAIEQETLAGGWRENRGFTILELISQTKFKSRLFPPAPSGSISLIHSISYSV